MSAPYVEQAISEHCNYFVNSFVHHYYNALKVELVCILSTAGRYVNVASGISSVSNQSICEQHFTKGQNIQQSK